MGTLGPRTAIGMVMNLSEGAIGAADETQESRESQTPEGDEEVGPIHVRAFPIVFAAVIDFRAEKLKS